MVTSSNNLKQILSEAVTRKYNVLFIFLLSFVVVINGGQKFCSSVFCLVFHAI